MYQVTEFWCLKNQSKINQKRQLKKRRNRKENISKILAAYPESANILKCRDSPGRPRVNHENHIDGRFCTATINAVEELSSFLGPKEVFFMSNDDKARVSIGLTAAKQQAPMVMHVEYKVTLPDHDWVVAARHKLIPSVYAGIVIKPDGLGKPEAVGYSGPTYIAIRSGKHSSSTAFSHCLDVQKVVDMPEFDVMSKHNGKIKPVFIFTVDGGGRCRREPSDGIGRGGGGVSKMTKKCRTSFMNGP